ncbi:coiled-coil domain-containing protein 87-like isoform X2 [Rhopilema esculentum]|uniref:coiled-coil domain-containing protein 87-like isoform X2 n=1 Tax=Rhopilema esculentum TaxID=499914 RepID=UPI0031DB8AF9
MNMDTSIPSIQSLPLDILNFHKQFTADLEHFGLKDSDSDNEESTDIPEEERPVTPIEVAIKRSPKTIQELKELIHKRLHIQDGIPSVKSQDQMELAATLMSETSAIWPDMRHQAPDPFLSAADNKELERRVAIEVVKTVENLFTTYIKKLQEVNLKGVFSSSSNVSRLKTQLSFEANKSLNILNVRRKLATALRNPESNEDVLSEDSFVIKVREKLLERKKEQPTGRIARKLQITRMHAEELYRQLEIKDLNEKMPSIDVSKFLDTGSPFVGLSMPKPATSKLTQTPVTPNDGNDEDVAIENKQKELLEEDGKLQFRLQKSHSLQMPDTTALFLEELELTEKDLKPERKRSIERLPVTSMRIDGIQEKEKALYAKSPREDLENLFQREILSRKVADGFETDVLEDMPPLLQALPVSRKGKRNLKKDVKEEELDTSETESVASTISTLKAINTGYRGEERISELPPQPAVVSKSFNKKDIVRASDVRVSSRENASQVTLKKHHTIYNSFKGEIDDATVKWLDRNLFAGDEIKEVYGEIVTTISKVHLQYDQDDFVVKCPLSLDNSNAKSSQTSEGKEARIFNKQLVGKTEPPWGKEGASDWRNSPKFDGLGRQEILKLRENANKELNSQELDYSHQNQKKPVKSYAAWLAWWRSTMNSEDFYKYVSTGENDFLTKIFHLYDSEDEDENADGSSNTIQEDPETLARRRRYEERQAKLQADKSKYNEGFWNVNTILLGGLGKEPDLDDDSVCSLSAIGEGIATKDGKTSASGKSTRMSQISSELMGSKLIRLANSVASDYLPPPELTLQDRLERVWTMLKMPDNLRVDMAIKYSMDENARKFSEMVQCWEIAASCVVKREELISALEKFERNASDPNRFFGKGSKRSSLARLEESKTRSALHRELHRLDDTTKHAILKVRKMFKDVVTYQGRPYIEKMSSDKTEMLYWLQEERRAAALEQSFNDRKGKTSELPPIATMTLL